MCDMCKEFIGGGGGCCRTCEVLQVIVFAIAVAVSVRCACVSTFVCLSVCVIMQTERRVSGEMETKMRKMRRAAGLFGCLRWIRDDDDESDATD